MNFHADSFKRVRFTLGWILNPNKGVLGVLTVKLQNVPKQLCFCFMFNVFGRFCMVGEPEFECDACHPYVRSD